MHKIVLTGPESSGKTTLAQQLAQHFDTQWIPEFARGYIERLERPYEQFDLLEIAKGQVAQEEFFFEKNTVRPLFLDTSLEVLKIWSEHRFGDCDPWIREQLSLRCHDLYLLCRPDLPWQPDPQRENPFDRELLYEIYRRELSSLGVFFIEINGLGEHRLGQALEKVNLFLNH